MPGIINSINEVTDVQIFSAVGTTTWVKPTGCKFVYVVCIGGGGGGGGGALNNNAATKHAGAGGGGGAITYKFYRASDLLSVETVVVASGGPGGISATIGSNGGNSTFSSGATLLTA